MGEVYCGRGNESLYGDYIDFINYVFGFNGSSDDFVKLLPKIYKPGDKPVESSYIALDNGRIKAAVGAFDHKLNVCGVSLKCRGIGNVAVHPHERAKGYMKTLMNMSVEDMIKDGIDLSVLGGRRQRYNYFSYEKTGVTYHFALNNDNMRHCFGADRASRHTMQVRELNAVDTELLERITALSARQSFDPCRPADKLFDILRSWKSVPFVFLKDGVFSGYIVFGSNTVYEIVLEDRADFTNAIISFYDTLKLSKLTVNLPGFCPDYIKALYRTCESYEISPTKSFSVLNYRRVTDAFLRLRATYEKLPDGELTLLIHGRAGDESIRLCVSGGETSVTAFEGKCEQELDHIDAANMLFSAVCPGRELLSDFARLLLPLPIWIYYPDAV